MAEFWNGLDSAEKLYIIAILAIIPVMLFGVITSISVNLTFNKYEKRHSEAGVSASQVAKRMLVQNGLEHVGIERVGGRLTDHYDPRSDMIALSDSVYSSTSMAAIGVACHEAGHALQHNNGYIFAKIRSALVPAVNISNKIFFPLLIIGILFGIMINSTFGTLFVYAALITFGLSTLFAFVTLPTEFDASNRALKALRSDGSYSRKEIAQARKVLKAAALTYVASFLLSLVQFLRYLAIFLMRMNNNKKR